MPTRFAIPALISVAIALALALPAVASAVQFSLTVHKIGTGKGTVQCEVFGSGSAGPCATKYAEGTELTLYAEASPGSQFIEWSEDCGPEECELTMDEPHSATVEFALIPEFSLTVHKIGTGQGTVQCEVFGSGSAGPCATKYPEGTELILLAKADLGSEFVKWQSEPCEWFEDFEECELTMDEPHSVTATFDLEPALKVTKSGTGTGTVECEAEEGPEECKAKYPKGTELTLLAEPNLGSEFTGFSAGTGSTSSCSTSPCAFTIEANSSVTATFNLPAKPKFTLTVTKSGTGTGTVTSAPAGISCGVTCSAEFEESKEVTLTAVSGANTKTVAWEGCASEPSPAKCKVTMSAAKLVRAYFTATVGAPTSSPPPAGEAIAAGNVQVEGGKAPIGGGRARIEGSEARIRGGKARIKVSCVGPGSCVGVLKLVAKPGAGKGQRRNAGSVMIGKAAFNLAPGASSMLEVKLSRQAKQLLKSGEGLKAVVTGSGVQSRTVKLIDRGLG